MDCEITRPNRYLIERKWIFITKTKMLHLLCWHLNDISSHIEKIKEQGFTHIMISPIQPTKTNENQFYWLYQPTSFSIGNRLGTKEEYITLCENAHKNGIKIIVDVVLRHLAGRDDGSLYPHEKSDKYITSKRDFWIYPIQGNEESRLHIINRCFGLPSLNYYNAELIGIYKEFLQEVLLYADGIRVDMGKHFALPYEGGCQFWVMVCNLCKDMNKECYAECINLDQHLMSDYINYTNVLVAEYEVPQNSSKALVFFESHDTYYTWGNTVYLTDKERIEKYNYLISRYDKVLLFARPYDNMIFGEEIRLINNTYW